MEQLSDGVGNGEVVGGGSMDYASETLDLELDKEIVLDTNR